MDKKISIYGAGSGDRVTLIRPPSWVQYPDALLIQEKDMDMEDRYPVRQFVINSRGVMYYEMPKVASNSICAAIHSTNTSPQVVPIQFRFTYVRHPLARLVSAYVEKIQQGKIQWLTCSHKMIQALQPSISIEDFVDFLVNFDSKNYDGELLGNHWCPQSWLVNSMPPLDFVGCLENIKEEWPTLMERGLGPLPHKHKTENIPTWQQILDTETETKARKFYHEDFDMWPNWWN